MRVALISGTYPPMKCGIGDFTRRLAEGLADAGNHVEVITSRGGGAEGDRVVVKPLVERWDLGAVQPILRRLQEMAPNIVNIQYPTASYHRHPMVNALPVLIRARLRYPVVATIHEFSTYTALGRARLALTARLSQAVIVNDRLNQNLLQQWARGAPQKYNFIPIGPNLTPAPPEEYDRARHRARLGAGRESVVLAYFGFISRSKGLDALFDAFSTAVETIPDRDLRLWLLASRAPASEDERVYYLNLEQRLAAFPHRERVVWTDYLAPPEVSAHLLAADLAVLPFQDGVSLRRGSLLASLAHGLPVVSTRGPDSVGEIPGEGAGLSLVPVGDREALSEAIVALCRNERLRHRLAADAAQFARGFSWSRIAARTLDVYERISL